MCANNRLIEKRYSNRFLQTAKRRLRYWLNNPDRCHSNAIYLEVLQTYRSGYFAQHGIWELCVSSPDAPPTLLAIRTGWENRPSKRMNFAKWVAEFAPDDEYDWLLAIPLYGLLQEPATSNDTALFRSIFRDALIRRPGDLKFTYPEIIQLSNQEIAYLLPRLAIAPANTERQ